MVVLAFLFVLGVILGPTVWCTWTIRSNGRNRSDFPGSGGEFARHLLDRAGLEDVKVEMTGSGDHYDGGEKAVRLLRQHYEGKSLSGVVIAAHEVGHALQDRDGYAALRARDRLVRSTFVLEQVGSAMMLAAPLVGLLTRAPPVALVMLGIGISTLALRVLVHFVTLPVEYDASFNRALPILDQGGYLPKEDLPAARRLLKAAALTYVAASLMTLLNLWRWIRVLR
jgi:Zn-dependent membrane protease YugP